MAGHSERDLVHPSGVTRRPRRCTLKPLAAGPKRLVLEDPYHAFAPELADDVVVERGAVVAAGQGKAMAADGVRERVAI